MFFDDIPIKNGDSPVRYVKKPEGIYNMVLPSFMMVIIIAVTWWLEKSIEYLLRWWF